MKRNGESTPAAGLNRAATPPTLGGPQLADQIAETGRQWIRHDWPLPETMVTITSIMRASQIITTHMEAALREFDLTVARYEVLIMIYFSRHEALPLSKIGERLQVHQTSITRVVDGLVSIGYVTRRSDPSDRRTRLAELTEDGRAAVTAAKDRVAESLFRNLGLSGIEQDQVVKLLNQVRDAAGDSVDAETLAQVTARRQPGD